MDGRAYRLIDAARRFSLAVESLDKSAEIIAGLQDTLPQDLSVVAIWWLPRLGERASDYVLHVTLFPGPRDACRALIGQWMRGSGPSPVSLLARRTSGPLLLSTAKRRLKLRKHDPIIKLYQAHGFEDAVYVPTRQWMGAVASQQVLSPAPIELYLIGLLVHIAIARIDVLTTQQGRRSKQGATSPLTERETFALELRSHGHGPAEIARQLGVSQETVGTFLKRAETKLQTKDLVHTACAAVRLRLIE